MAAPTKGFLVRLVPSLLGRHTFQTPPRWQACSCGRVLNARHCSDDGSTSEAGLGRKFVPRRAMMYVPGNDERKLRKIPSLDLDCVVMDCEDGVAINRKEEARSTILRMLDMLEFGRMDIAVRVNAMTSGLAEEDMAVTLTAARLPTTLMLPKVEDVRHIDWFAEQMSVNLNQREEAKAPNLVIFVESARGLLNLQSICERAFELSELGAPFHLDGIVFGSDDFCADIGATRTADAQELLYARQKVITVAKAYRLQAIDLVHIDYKDLDELRTQALKGAQMGFTGKQVIHPSQIPVVQEAFTPSEEKIDWAKELIDGFDQHQSSGMGAFVFRGSMIDMPLVLQARNILQTVQNITEHREALGTQGERCTEPKNEDNQSEEEKPEPKKEDSQSEEEKPEPKKEDSQSEEEKPEPKNEDSQSEEEKPDDEKK